ncbi:hypothetical protein L6452_02381 [Arctium lappa]|uniref:Uncharacterized protein n=1 Tax=Arctium lappa TaxID=4217 RepID=A0ACB9FKS1_ARCLA|nr:hypothetical protein L6452_02381 [Arctium lappa]
MLSFMCIEMEYSYGSCLILLAENYSFSLNPILFLFIFFILFTLSGHINLVKRGVYNISLTVVTLTDAKGDAQKSRTQGWAVHESCVQS